MSAFDPKPVIPGIMSSWFSGRRDVMNGDKQPGVERTNIEIVAAVSCGAVTRLSGKL